MLSTMVKPPIVRDFAFIKSSVPFPSTTTANNQTGVLPEPHRPRTSSNSSSSSSSGLSSRQQRTRGTSMSGRTQKQLSPVAEEFEGDQGRRRSTSTARRVRSRSRASHHHKPRPTSYVGQTGLTAEDLTIAMIAITPPRHHSKATARRGPMSKTKSRFHDLRQSIRARLPIIRLSRVWKR